MGNNPISSLVFVPPKPSTYTADKPYPVEWLTTKSKYKIPCYFLPATTATKTTIVYSHGNAADIGAMFMFLKLLRDNLPVNVLHYEYVGYGLAKGPEENPIAPSETGVYESIEAAFAFLNDKHQIKEEDIIIFGTSVGSGPSCHMASRKRIKGLILECPFMSIVRIVTENFLARAVDMFDNLSKIDKVDCPVLMFHGEKDEVVPYHHGKNLYEKVLEKSKYKFISLEHANHHDIIEQLGLYNYLTTILEFIKFCNSKQPNSNNNTQQQQPKISTTSMLTSDFSE